MATRMSARTLRIAAALSAAASINTGTCIAQVITDGTLGGATSLAGPDFAITADLGRTEGPNLFHSFSQFDIAQNQTATFSGPAGIARILSRVTGGSASTIDGALRSTIDGADLYLVNPDGVVFGPNATLDLTGSLIVTTADTVELADGGVFTADPMGNCVLTTAAPSAFGFLSPMPSAITVQDSTLEVAAGQSITIIGGNLTFGDTPTNGSEEPFIFAPSGQILLASVASPGTVILSEPGDPLDLAVDSFAGLGAIDLSDDATLSTRADPGGTVLIRGQSLTLIADSGISASSTADTDHPGVGIDIRLTGDMTVTDSEVASSTSGAARAGDIWIEAANLDISDDPNTPNVGANIGSRSFTTASGRGGDVTLMIAGDLTIRDGAFINTAALGTGEGGDMTVYATNLSVLDRGSISVNNQVNSGDAGSMDVTAESILISGAGSGNGFTSLGSFAGSFGGTGSAGNVTIETSTLEVVDGGEIDSITRGPGDAATVQITADTVRVGDGSGFAGIFANTFGPGAGGTVRFIVDTLDVNGGLIQAATLGSTGPGGLIDVAADSVTLRNGALFLVGTTGSGPGGDVVVNARSLHGSSNATIQALAFSSGAAGNVTLNLDELELTEATISTSSFFGTAMGTDAGDIIINADNILMVGSDDPNGPATSMTTTTGSFGGNGGDILINAQQVELINLAALSADSLGPGPGGDVVIVATTIELVDGAQIKANANAAGDGGTIDITADTLSMSGVNNVPRMTSSGLSLTTSGIGAQTRDGGGDAGDVSLHIGQLNVTDGALVTTNTFGPGRGGNVTIHADDVLIAGINQDLADFNRDSLGITDPLDASALVTATAGDALVGGPSGMTGPAGNVQVHATGEIHIDQGRIAASTETAAPAGNLELHADRIYASGARVLARSTGDGDAGGALLNAAHSIIIRDWTVVNASSERSNGGGLLLQAGNTIDIADSEILGSAQLDGADVQLQANIHVRLTNTLLSAEAGVNGGNITIDPQAVIVNNSQIIANAILGAGGNITIITDAFLLSADSLVSASSQFGVSGTVEVSAPDADLAGSLARLPASLLDAQARLSADCAAMVANTSSFIVSGRGGLPTQPDGLQPGHQTHTDPHATPHTPHDDTLSQAPPPTHHRAPRLP